MEKEDENPPSREDSGLSWKMKGNMDKRDLENKVRLKQTLSKHMHIKNCRGQHYGGKALISFLENQLSDTAGEGDN